MNPSNQLMKCQKSQNKAISEHAQEPLNNAKCSRRFLTEIEANLKCLASETDDFKKSEFFKNYLETMSKFWQYSYHNQLLIFFQKPKATRVAGFKKWQELNRKVLKGQKAIKILAPFIKKVIELKPGTLEEVEKEITLFFPVSVFDISQKDGEQVPEISLSITGDSYKGFLQNLVSFCEQNRIKVNFKNLGINGVYGYSKGGEIAVSNSESVNTQVNTMIHEISHELLHNENKELSKQQKEIQAEGTAYVVTKHFGLENRSFNYLALYDADYHKIMENLKAIAEASKEIIEFLENKQVYI